jgi:hypothetical protein
MVLVAGMTGLLSC